MSERLVALWDRLSRQRHDPTNMKSRQGCWVTCTCGWQSATWTTVGAAYANFGRHLLQVNPPD